MKIEETPLKGCYLITPDIYQDERGLFFEHYHQKKLNTILPKDQFVQDNVSVSKKGVLRGIHFQKGDFAQTKLVSVLKGMVQDVVVDLRIDSNTFGQYHSVFLDDVKRHLLFIPRGFAHGFLALSNEVIFSYKCDNFYNKESEIGIVYNDADLNIKWQLPNDNLIVSRKDLGLPCLKELKI
ncbi:dTDP-4-dehydrorhamnose 3,5-epimerase [Spongiivirga sp. MCCC 1A20706]|uniref:dTDP-4-dehydrorhamnose 3,5-epimerase n=1 Tax=Spongiivirga sp. MCCC 1A20706 TaxID=3160963 RepID=UPI003977B8B7